MQYLLDQGLIHYWGTSRWSPMHISEAYNVARHFHCTPPSCEQMEYHMFNRNKMELYMPELFHKIGVGCIVWSPAAMNHDDGIQLITRRSAFYEEKFLRSSKHVELAMIAAKLGCDTTQLTIGRFLPYASLQTNWFRSHSLEKLNYVYS